MADVSVTLDDLLKRIQNLESQNSSLNTQITNLKMNRTHIVRFKFVNCTSPRSIKLLKGVFLLISSNNWNGLQSTSTYFYETTASTNDLVINEATLVYDGEDDNFRYYHLKLESSSSDNYGWFIQGTQWTP